MEKFPKTPSHPSHSKTLKLTDRHLERRKGRPPGPSRGRGDRPWDPLYLCPRDKRALLHIAANPSMPRFKIAVHIGISPSKLSNISCSPLGVRFLDRLKQIPPHRLSGYRLEGIIGRLRR